MILIYQGANQEAEPVLTEGLAAAGTQGDALRAAQALIGLGGLAIMQGDHVHAAALLQESLAATQAVADHRLAQIMAGRVRSISPSLPGRKVNTHWPRAPRGRLRLQREVGYAEGIILAQGDLGDLARDQGDYPRALALYRKRWNWAGTSRNACVTEVIEAVGIVATAGQAERAARFLSAASAQRDRLGLRYRVRENQVALEQAVAAARPALGEEAFHRVGRGRS